MAVAGQAGAEPSGWRAAGTALSTTHAPRTLPATGGVRRISDSAVQPGAAQRAYCEAEGDVNHGAIHRVSYSTGEAGGRLKWLPRRAGHVVPASAEDDGGTGAVVGADALEGPFSQFGQDAVSVDGRPAPAPLAPSAPGQLLMPVFPTAQDAAQPPEELSPEDLGGDAAPLFDEGDQYSHLEAQLRKCPSPDDFKKITEITTSTEAEKGEFPYECSLGNATFEPRNWCPLTYTWTASAIGHKPLYFEDVQLERYGHSWGPYIQPVMSMANFYLTIPILPYKMGLEPPNECIYDLGYYRPGSCAPYMLDPLPLSVRAALFEAGVWTGAVFAIP